MSSNPRDFPVVLCDVGDVVAPKEHLGANHARRRIRGGARGRPVPLGGAASADVEINFLPGAFLMTLLALLQGVTVEDPEIVIF